MIYGRKLHRIQALYDFADVTASDIGGYVETERNLSQEGGCWIYDDATVYDFAIVHDDAQIRDQAVANGYACIFGNSKILENSIVSGNAQIFGEAAVRANAIIEGNIKIFNDALISPLKPYHAFYIDEKAHFGKKAFIRSTDDYICIGPIGSRRDTVTFYRTTDGNIFVVTGCFNDNIDQLEKKVKERHGSNAYGQQYQVAIDLARLHFPTKS